MDILTVLHHILDVCNDYDIIKVIRCINSQLNKYFKFIFIGKQQMISQSDNHCLAIYYPNIRSVYCTHINKVTNWIIILQKYRSGRQKKWYRYKVDAMKYSDKYYHLWSAICNYCFEPIYSGYTIVNNNVISLCTQCNQYSLRTIN
jgi:hypothetical protein